MLIKYYIFEYYNTFSSYYNTFFFRILNCNVIKYYHIFFYYNYFSIIIYEYLIIIFVIKCYKFKYSFTQMIGDKITLI
jgi:hypothetical protein